VSELENTITSRAFDIGTTELLCLAEAFRVELRLRQGSSEGAGHWIQSYQGPSFKLMLRFYVPDLTYCRALINQGGNENLKRAENRLKELKEFVEKTNNRRVLIDVHLLRALVHLSKDKEERALVDLDKGVRLAEKGGFVRCFLDLGKPIADLLVLLARDGVHVSFIGKLLRAFRKEASRTVASEMEYPVSEPLLSSEILVEPLSNRELEMLNLVSRGLRNKEIAEKLFVSQDTVKKHLYNSYQKLGVKNRRGAVARVNELGLLHKEYSY
jgi:ATP/maltotriose-dependent transcriptional regulator MalT